MVVFIIFLKILGMIILGIFVSLLFCFGIAFYSAREKNLFNFIKAFIFDFLIAIALLFIFPLIRVFKKNFPPSQTKSSKHLPVLLIHGYRMNSTNWIFFTYLFKKIASIHFYTFNYSCWENLEATSKMLAQKARAILEKENQRELILIGHSLGGLIARYWIENLGGENQVKQLITLGTPHHGNQFARWVPEKEIRKTAYQAEFIQKLRNFPFSSRTKYLSIYSMNDELIRPAESARLEGESSLMVQNFSVSGIGHLALLFSLKVVRKISVELEEC